MRYIKKTGLIAMLMFAGFSVTVKAQQTEHFKTDVETFKTPWTNLEFYNDPDNFQFALVSDNTGGSRPGIFELGVEKLNMMMPEFVLSVGDLIQGYTEDTIRIREEWDDFNQKIDKLNVPFFYLPGNHDITNIVMQKEWEKRYGRRYYSFTYKNVLFLILDSNDDDDHNLTDEQTAFALETLNKHPDVRWTFVLMHHPIWKYDTDGKFEKIETALNNRKYSVIAGHEHHYEHSKRKSANYYVLGTTGGSSALRGNRFGEFDHIVWVTMADNGPIMANLRLDGILSHDIANPETNKLARTIIDNSNFKPLILTNSPEEFTTGTAYLNFKNTADVPLIVDISFLHHHQADIQPSKQKVRIQPGDEKTLEISIKSHNPTDYKTLGFVRYYWNIRYEGEAYKDFFLDGQADFSIAPSQPNYFYPQTPQFVHEAEITYRQPFDMLKTNLLINNETQDENFPEKLIINQTSELKVFLSNEKNERSASAVKTYTAEEFLKGKKIKDLQAGLSYAYYEGDWTKIPDFTTLTPVKTGLTDDFSVTDLAIKKNNFGIRFTGFIEIKEEGLYFFRCRADDAALLKIQGKPICLDGSSQVYENKDNQLLNYGAVALKKGFHPVEIDYIENKGSERLRFYHKRSEAADWEFTELTDFFRTGDRK